MPAAILIMMILLPIIDIASLVEAGRLIGTWPTVASVVVAVAIGIIIVSNQGVSIAAQAHDSLRQGQFPAQQIFDGACVLVAGLLFLFPGFVSDALGLALLLPFLRRTLWKLLGNHLKRGGNFYYWRSDGSGSPDPTQKSPVIDGEYEPIGDSPLPSPHADEDYSNQRPPPPSPWQR